MHSAFRTAHSAFFVVGPTAVGKSEIAVELAERRDTEILNADAFQLYAGLALLTAKPSADALLRVRHHLVGVFALSESMSVARYLEAARNVADAGIPARAARAWSSSEERVSTLARCFADCRPDRFPIPPFARRLPRCPRRRRWPGCNARIRSLSSASIDKTPGESSAPWSPPSCAPPPGRPKHCRDSSKRQRPAGRNSAPARARRTSPTDCGPDRRHLPARRTRRGRRGRARHDRRHRRANDWLERVPGVSEWRNLRGGGARAHHHGDAPVRQASDDMVQA